MTNITAVRDFESDNQILFSELSDVQKKIKEKLVSHSDGKNLKGNELVGWLGEIYAKLLLGGKLVHDREEHDVVTNDGHRVSVKTRKGWGNGWQRTSAIPKFEGDDCPTHLLFVHLNDDYSIDRMWLFSWEQLRTDGRFKIHKVHKSHRSFIFALNEVKDKAHIVYSGT